jgi:cell division transport system permease protein
MSDRLRPMQKRPLHQQLRAWWEQHQDAARSALRRLLTAPLASPLTIAVIGIALVLPATLQVIADNARVASHGLDAALDVSVYLKGRLPDEPGRSLTAKIAARPDVQHARYVSSAEGLAEFRRWSGLGASLDALGRNPLPATIVVRPRAEFADPAAIDRLVASLQTVPEVDQVQFDGLWARRYGSLVDAVSRLAEILGGLLAVAVLLIIGNTVRLDVDARRHEIDVMKLVGASDGFVRRPFLYGGLWYGLLGGLAGAGLLELLVLLARGPVSRVAAAYGSAYALSAPSLTLLTLLVMGGAGLGWIGAWTAATRQLQAIEPGRDD